MKGGRRKAIRGAELRDHTQARGGQAERHLRAVSYEDKRSSAEGIGQSRALEEI